MEVKYDAILGKLRESDAGGGSGSFAPAALQLSAAPTSSTAGQFGQHAIDTTTGKEYTCTAVTVDDTDPQNPVTTYEWVDDINAHGGTFTSDIKVNTINIGNKGRLNSGTLQIGYIQNNLNTSYGLITVGYNIRAYNSTWLNNGVAVFGKLLWVLEDSSAVFGKSNFAVSAARVTGNSGNIEELDWNGNLFIRGGHQQRVLEIPSATSEYTLAEGCFMHAPAAAPTYTLPSILMMICANEGEFVRDTSLDGTGYYGWGCGGAKRYTASATPAIGDNTYTNTALTAGAKAITAIDRRTHECILTVRFSASALSVAFQDAAGNAITPLPLAGTIADGSVVCYRCTWEELLGRWVIMPVMLGTYSAGV